MKPVDIVYKNSGYEGIERYLRDNPNTVCNDVLSEAAANNDLVVVQFVLPYSDALYSSSLPFRRAVNKGHYSMVELLRPVSDPKAIKCAALLRAVENNDLRMVQILLPYSDPKMRRSEFLQRCVYHNLKDIARVLWPLSNIEVVRREVSKGDGDHARLQLGKMQQWEAEFQNENIQRAIDPTTTLCGERKSKM